MKKEQTDLGDRWSSKGEWGYFGYLYLLALAKFLLKSFAEEKIIPAPKSKTT